MMMINDAPNKFEGTKFKINNFKFQAYVSIYYETVPVDIHL